MNDTTIRVTVRSVLDSQRWTAFCEAMGLDPWNASPAEGADESQHYDVPIDTAIKIWGEDLSRWPR